MTRFSDVIGYRETSEDPPDSGDFKAVITEVPYFGEVIRDTRQSLGGGDIHSGVSISNRISVHADAKALASYHDIVYVKWNGVAWTVPEVLIEYPRLILSPGEVYNGPFPAEP